MWQCRLLSAVCALRLATTPATQLFLFSSSVHTAIFFPEKVQTAMWYDLQHNMKFLLCPSASFSFFCSCTSHSCRTIKSKNKKEGRHISQRQLKDEGSRGIIEAQHRKRMVKQWEHEAVLGCNSDWSVSLDWSPFIQSFHSRIYSGCFGGEMQGAVKFFPCSMVTESTLKQFYRGLMSFHISLDLQWLGMCP